MTVLSGTGSIFFVIISLQISGQCFSARKKVSAAVPETWQDTPRNPAIENDPASPEIRRLRDAYFSQLLSPMISPPGAETGCLQGSWLASTPEFARTTRGAWIIGTFKDFNVFPTIEVKGATYTEIYVDVNDVIAQSPGLTLSIGNVIDTGVAGGAVDRPGKPPLFFLHCPSKYSPQPGHKYLIQVFYNPETQSYAASWRWDLTDGTVQPNSQMDAWRAANGKSQIDGTSASDIGQRMRQILVNR
jgi:hypothetical protein